MSVYIAICVLGWTVLVVRAVVVARPTAFFGIRRWLHSPSRLPSPPPLWKVCLGAGVLNLRHLWDEEPAFWPAALAFGLAWLLRHFGIHDRGDIQRVLDHLLGVGGRR